MIAPQPAKTSANAASASAVARRRRAGRLSASSRGGDKLLAVFARKACGGDLARDGARVVVGALDRHPHLARDDLEQRERGARIAVLRLPDRAAVDEQHSPVLP